jgi:hypothetical protein
MAGYEPDDAVTWIIAQLSANTAITSVVGNHPVTGVPQIYERVAPAGATYPLVLVALINGVFKKGQGGYRIFMRGFYEIKGIDIGETYSENLSTLARAIDSTMNLNQLSTTDVVAGSSAVRPVQREDYEDNTRHNHYGAEYEVWIYSNSTDVLPVYQLEQFQVNAVTIVVSGTLTAPLVPTTYLFDTSSGDIAETLFPALGDGKAYQFINLGSGNVILAFQGSDVLNGVSTWTLGPYESVTIASYTTGIWSGLMAYFPGTPGGSAPEVVISATSALSMPAQDTRYTIRTAATTVTTLPQATGSGRKLYFDVESIVGGWTLALHAGDAYVTALPTNPAYNQVGSSFGLVDTAAGNWDLE